VKKNIILQFLVLLFISSIYEGCATNDAAIGIQSENESIGRGLTVEAPTLIESDVAVFPLLGHTTSIRVVEISTDNEYVISSDDKNCFINLWEIESGRLLRTFFGHNAAVTVLAFSPDGKNFVSGDNDGIIKTWNIAAGKELCTLSGHVQQIHSLNYSPDSTHIVSASRDRTITIWDAENGAELYVFGDNNEATCAAFSPNGRYVAASTANSLVIWEAGSGKKVKVLQEGEWVWSVSWSSDGKNIVSCNDNGVISIWNVETGLKINSIASNDIGGEKQKAVYLSKDTIVSWSYGRYGVIITWNTETGQKILKKEYLTECFGSISRDGRFFVRGSYKSMEYIDFNTFDVLRKFEMPPTTFKQFVLFDHNTQQIIINRFSVIDNKKYFLDIKNAKLQETVLALGTLFIVDGVYSRDGKKVAVTDYFGYRVSIHDALKGGKAIKTLELTDARSLNVQFDNVAFSPDNKFVVVGGRGAVGNIKIWELGSTGNGRIIRSFSGDDTSAVNWSGDGRYIASGHYNDVIRIWNAETYKEEFKLMGHTKTVNSVTFSPDVKYLASGSDDTTVRIWGMQDRKELLCIDDGIGAVKSVEYSPDGRCLIVTSYDSSIYLYDVSNVEDGNSKRNRKIVQVAIFRESSSDEVRQTDEWIIITPDGYYSASPGGDRYLNVRVGNTVTGIDSYRSIFYNPDVVQARLQGKPDPASKANVTIQQAANFTPPRVTIQSPVNYSTTNTATANLSVTVTDNNQPLQNIKILVNGRLLGSNELSALKGSSGLQAQKASLSVTGNQKTVNFDLPLKLDPGRNIIEVVAFNGYSESPRIPIEVTWNAPAGEKPPLPNLWILAVGVNNYNDANIRNLNFCVADAKGVIASLKAQEGKRYAKVNSLIIADGESLAPTADIIRKNLNFLDKAGERDVVLLFLAGHGVSNNAGKFLFLPTDVKLNADKSVAENTTITDGDIVKVLDRAGNLLVFIDACQSGGVDNDRLVRSLMDTNAFVFTSSRGNELSQERRDLGHGVFTYSIMEGIKGAVAAQAQGNVTVLSLSGFVSQDVPRITGGAQNPKAYSLGFYDFPVAVIK